jgi:ATP-binding cassette subfamily F protein uup
VFLVSHDRTFLDNVVTSTIAFEGNGNWREYEGGVQDWLTQSRRRQAWLDATDSEAPSAILTSPEAEKDLKKPVSQRSPGSAKLSYKEQRELETLPDHIEALELEQAQLREELADGSLYSRNPQRAVELHARDATIEDELMAALTRWEALSARQ